MATKLMDVNVGYANISVFEANLAEEKDRPDDCGYSDFDTMEIWLDSSIIPNEEKFTEVLFHECFHFLLDFANVAGKLDETEVVDDNVTINHERIVRTSARAMLMLLRLNPHLLEHLSVMYEAPMSEMGVAYETPLDSVPAPALPTYTPTNQLASAIGFSMSYPEYFAMTDMHKTTGETDDKQDS